MASYRNPTKEEVRAWLQKEIANHQPPPTPERVREMLGWKIIEAERKATKSSQIALF